MRNALLIALLFLWSSCIEAEEKTFQNSIGMEFVLIPAGAFVMGTDRIFLPGDLNESPPRRVRLGEPFYIGKYEVTQAQWRAVMGSNPSRFKGEDHPVESVSWREVQRFILELNRREGGHKYRLPTEAEWEYAARAGTKTSYFFGNDAKQLGQYAWYSHNAKNSTHPVGYKAPNPWGLYDIYGNVWEWVWDWYDQNYYMIGDPLDPRGPNSGYYRVNRGGSWYSQPFKLRSAKRGIYTPDNHVDIIGFRLVRKVREKRGNYVQE